MTARRAWALLLAAWASLSSAHAIVGATSDAAGPYATGLVMVLNRQGSLAGFCSGIVIRQDVVLTAAHCVPERADLKVHVREGAANNLLDVAAVQRSPGYRADAIQSRQRSIDLALVRLAAPLPATFHPVALADVTGAPAGARFRIAGFGVAREGQAATSGVLRTAPIVVQAPLSAVLLWGRGADGRGGACTGDSGGPVLSEGDAVVAVIAWSAGRGATHCGALTQAVWLAPHRAWIDGVLATWPRPD